MAHSFRVTAAAVGAYITGLAGTTGYPTQRPDWTPTIDIWRPVTAEEQERVKYGFLTASALIILGVTLAEVYIRCKRCCGRR